MLALRESVATFRSGTFFKLSFVGLVYLDLLATLYAVNHGFIEMNPIMAQLMNRPGELFLVKVVAPLAIAWLIPSKLLLPSIALLLLVTGLNARELLTSF